MTLPRSLFLAASLILSVSLEAQTYGPTLEELRERFERILVPIFIPDVAFGANRSIWQSSFWVYNDGNAEVEFIPNVTFIDPLPEKSVLAPGELTIPRMFGLPPSMVISRSVPGRLVFLEKRDSLRVTFNLRLIGPAGETEIPIVREADFREERLHLLYVRFPSSGRLTIRTYDPDIVDGAQALIRIISMNSKRILLTSVRTFRTLPAECCFSEVPSYPNYDQLDLQRSDLAELSDKEPFRIEIEPITEDLRLWSFASVTDNVTNHVTVIWPQ